LRLETPAEISVPSELLDKGVIAWRAPAIAVHFGDCFETTPVVNCRQSATLRARIEAIRILMESQSPLLCYRLHMLLANQALAVPAVKVSVLAFADEC
jgi:hypothetical protein